MGVLHIWYFVLYFSFLWVNIPLYFRYIHIFINMFVSVITMFASLSWCYSYDMLLCCNPYWENCYAYFGRHPHGPAFKNWITVSLFELIVTCIEIYVFFTSFSISHVFIYIVIFSVVSYSYGSSSLKIFNTLRHVSNIIFILSLIKYPVFHYSSSDTCGSNVWH